MKKCLLIVLTLCLFLSACSAATNNDQTDPTSTQPTETESDPTSTQPTETEPDPTSTQPTETEPDPNALTEDEIAKLQTLFEGADSASITFFYNIAIGQTYSDPRQIDLYRFFYNGDQTDWTMTDEEFAFIKSAIEDAEYMSLFRSDPENMDAILQMCYGLSLQDMQGNGLDSFAYFEETGCYYNAATSPPSFAELLKIIGGTHLDDGNLQVFYTAYYNEQLYVMILMPVEDGYHILSNLEVKE